MKWSETNMEILNSGSFVPLDNRERIEELIFTAQTLATEVSRTEGFQSSGPTNHQLGLEMWKGAEYMCRAHEAATIRNLFLSKFLERLREIERQSAVQPRPVQTRGETLPTTRPPVPSQPQVSPPAAIQPTPGPTAAAPSCETAPASQPQEARDEYLGVISETPEIDSGRPSYADECKPDFERESSDTYCASEAEVTVSAADESNEDEPKESILTESALPDAQTVTEPGNIAEASTSVNSETPAGQEEYTAEASTPDNANGVGSIVLSEKEPYNFDSCTVTAVVQLLPENEGTRKCLFSVRSHDFTPEITSSDLCIAAVNDGIRQCLETAIESYRANLPVLAAEKMKKQKSASKKRSSKTGDKDAKATSAPVEKKSTAANVPPAAQSSETARDQRNLFAS